MKKYILVGLVIAAGVALLIFEISNRDTTSPTAGSQLESEILVALEEYNPRNKKCPPIVIIVGASGNFVRFNTTPRPCVELDPAFGFAEKRNDKWVILTHGTGGDPTEFYKKYSIPEELRDKGF
ncbi:MAG: hypothetical protein WD200_01925 [Candidatus Andersenbacteria bacterium]